MQTIGSDARTTLYVWQISESEPDLSSIALNENSKKRLEGMKSELHRRGFLSVRHLLQHAGYSDFDLFYDPTGKPFLRDGKHISISHSHELAAVAISDRNLGIDLELQRDKILVIAHKFTSVVEEAFLDAASPDYIRKLTVMWGVKEAVFKLRNEIGISFKDHVWVQPFDLADGFATAVLDFEGQIASFPVRFVEIGNFTLVWLCENA